MVQNFYTVRFSLLLVALSVVGVVTAAAQVRQPPVSASPGESSVTGVIRGKIVLPSGASFHERARVTLQTVRGLAGIVYTDSQGQFEFTRLAPGSYQILIEADRERFETATENVEVVRSYPSVLSIILKEKISTKPRPTIATVSATELDPNVPANAKKEFDRASAASREGKVEEAIIYLRKAIAFYPQYLMAHNDLAAQLMKSGKLDDAEEELNLALMIDPSAFNPTLNLGIVLVKKHSFEEAVKLLDKALSFQPRSPAARLYLGLALLGTLYFERAEKELNTAYELDGKECVLALFHLGELYLSKGERDRARTYLERYLREAPEANNRDQVKKLLALLD